MRSRSREGASLRLRASIQEAHVESPPRSVPALAALALAASLCACIVAPARGQDRPQHVSVRPADHGRALVNPGMGFVLHHYDNSLVQYGSRLAPSDPLDDFPGLSTVYLRLAWSYVEPEEGRFDWSIVDSPAQRWIARGKKIALRFSASEGDPGVGTPLWVKAAGARGYFFEAGKGVVPEAPGLPWEPDFDDPVFLGKVDRFLAAAAARYDGDPNLAFVDVGSFGIWGEGQTFWSTKRNYSAETALRHIELYRKHFRKTLVVAIDDFSDHGRGDGWIPARSSSASPCATTASWSRAADSPTRARPWRSGSGRPCPSSWRASTTAAPWSGAPGATGASTCRRSRTTTRATRPSTGGRASSWPRTGTSWTG